MAKKTVLILLICFLTFIMQSQPGNGHLVIAGGGLIPGTSSAYNQLIEFAGGQDNAKFAVIPTASGVPVQSYAFVRKVLISYGVNPDNIFLIPISLADDDSTKNVDESTWAENGNDPQLAELIRNCTGVWFTGGDQMRITRALLRPGGSKTPVLEAIWEVYNKGGVIGGTSAGAAVMSGVMIGNGSSLGALQMDIITDNGPENEETDALLLSTGLGFFPEGIVDQHFSARARQGRLIVALMHSKGLHHLAFGVDENTALLYSAADRSIAVAGKAGVTIINASEASISYKNKLPEIQNLSVSYIEEGDRYMVATDQIIPAAGKKATRGNEYYNRENPAQGGILSPNGATFLDVMTINLIDNKATDKVNNLSFTGNETGFMLTFSKKPESQGYYAESEDEEDLYTVYDVRLDIRPVKVTLSEIE